MASSKRRKPRRCSPRMRNEMPPVMNPAASSGHAEEQVETQRGAHELGDVGGHRHALRLQPQKPGHIPRVGRPADLGQVHVGDDAELGREVLHEHGYQVGHEHDPEQQVAELGAALDVGREVAGIDVGDGGDKGRSQHGQQGAHATAGQEQFERRRNAGNSGWLDDKRALVDRRRHGCDSTPRAAAARRPRLCLRPPIDTVNGPPKGSRSSTSISSPSATPKLSR